MAMADQGLPPTLPGETAWGGTRTVRVTRITDPAIHAGVQQAQISVGSTLVCLSTFELLLQPQVSSALAGRFPELASVSRTVAQSYCLTLANLEECCISVCVSLITRTPVLKSQEVLVTFDLQDPYGPLILTPAPDAGSEATPGTNDIVRASYNLFLRPRDTGLFVIQADATKPDLRNQTSFAIRGFVELALSEASLSSSANVLVSAEHRAVCFDSSQRAGFGEWVVALPLAGGKAQVSLTRS